MHLRECEHCNCEKMVESVLPEFGGVHTACGCVNVPIIPPPTPVLYFTVTTLAGICTYTTHSTHTYQSWAWSLTRPSFFLYFREIRNKRSHWPQWPGGQSAPRLYNCYNLCPCARPAHVDECWPWPKFKFSKTVEVGWSC